MIGDDCEECPLKSRVIELEEESKSQAERIEALTSSTETLTSAIDALVVKVTPIANVYTRVEGFFSTSSWIGSIFKGIAATLIAIGVISLLVIEAVKIYAVTRGTPP